MTAPLTSAAYVASQQSHKARALSDAWIALLKRHGHNADTAASVKLFDSLPDCQFLRLWRDHARIAVPSEATIAQARAILVARLSKVEQVVLVMPADACGRHAAWGGR